MCRLPGIPCSLSPGARHSRCLESHAEQHKNDFPRRTICSAETFQCCKPYALSSPVQSGGCRVRLQAWASQHPGARGGCRVTLQAWASPHLECPFHAHLSPCHPLLPSEPEANMHKAHTQSTQRSTVQHYTHTHAQPHTAHTHTTKHRHTQHIHNHTPHPIQPHTAHTYCTPADAPVF